MNILLIILYNICSHFLMPTYLSPSPFFSLQLSFSSLAFLMFLLLSSKLGGTIRQFKKAIPFIMKMAPCDRTCVSVHMPVSHGL